MKLQALLIPSLLLISGQAAAWGDLLSNALQNAAQQAVTSTVQQAVTPTPTQVQLPAQQVPTATYGNNGCVQNVPAGPPNVIADTDRNGCVTHLEYANYISYLANNAPQYLGAGQAAAGAATRTQAHTVAPQTAAGQSPEAQAAGAAVQGLMGLFGR
jgi:hypothetical protein